MIERSKQPFLALLLALLLSGFAMTLAFADDVKVELRTFIAHGDVDDWGRTTGLSCVVTNDSDREVGVLVGYDGESNLLRSPVGRFAIALHPKAAPPPPHHENIPPGGSRVVYTLSLHAILLRGLATDESPEWQWGWAEPAPRPAPPRSPIHTAHGPGWHALEAGTATFVADILVDGTKVTSTPFTATVRRPDANSSETLALRFTTPEGETLIPGKDIVAYHWPSHSLRFQPGVIERLRSAQLKNLVSGAPFVLRLDGESVYTGRLSTSASSISQSGVVMLLDGETCAALQCGYPAAQFFKGEDPRNDERVRQELLRAGILLQ